MAQGFEVLAYYFPKGGWVIVADDYDSIKYDEGVTPITRKQYEDGFEIVDNLKKQKEESDKIKRQQLLNRLGITEDEAKLLLS